MKPALVVCVAFACSSSGPTPTPAPAPRPLVKPSLRLPDDAAPLRYRASLEIDPRTTRFRGRIEIDVTTKRALDALWLNAHELEITSARLRSGEREIALTAKLEPRNLVALVGAFPAGNSTVVIEYTGAQAEGRSEGLGKYVDAQESYIVTHFEPDAARRAFPCFDEPAFKVPWQLELVVPAPYVAFTNTAQTAEDKLPDGRRRFRFAPTRPLPPYLIAIAVGKFDAVDAGASRSGVPMRILVPRGRGGDAAYAAIEVGKVLAALEDYTGIPYGYDKLDHIVKPAALGGAMEHPGLITYGPRLLLIPDGESVAARQAHVEWVAHEVAHQWFGNLVTNAWWDDLWLNEAFATWLPPKIVEKLHPEMDADVEPVTARGAALAADALASARKIRQPIVEEQDMRGAFDSITYSKGASVIRMFESWIGEAPFQRAARAYLASHADKNATAADFLRALDAATETPVSRAMATFLDQPGVPVVDMKLVCESGKPPRLELAQRRFLAASTDAVWHIPVCVRAIDRTLGSTRVCTLLTEPTGSLVVQHRTAPPRAADRCPDWIAPNADGVGYYTAQLPADALAKLLADEGWAKLTRNERIALLGDLGLAIDAGHADLGAMLALLRRLGTSGDPFLIEIATQRISKLDHLVEPAQREVYAKLVRDVLGAYGAKLGWLPRAGDTPADARLRMRVPYRLATDGRDPATRDRALELARKWLVDPRSVPESLWSVVLTAAVRTRPQEMIDALVAKLPSTQDRGQQRVIYGALAYSPEIADLKRVLALLDPKAITAEQLHILWNAPVTIPLQVARFEYLREHKDSLVKRVASDDMFALVVTVCDAGRRDAVAEYLRSFASHPSVGAVAVKQELEQMDQCIARAAKHGPALASFLAR